MHMIKRIDLLLGDPIRTALEASLNPLPRENAESDASTSATPLMSMPASTSAYSQPAGSERIMSLLSEQLAFRAKSSLSHVSEKRADKASAESYYTFPSKTNEHNFLEFAITYDNKVFFTMGEGHEKLAIRAYGSLLKAVGCMQLDRKAQNQVVEGVGIVGISVPYSEVKEIVKYISVYNRSFMVHPDNIAVSLFVLEQLGLDLSATKVFVPNKSAKLIREINPDCHINIRGTIKEASFYLDETRFPGAKAIAENTDLTIYDKITALLYDIDDEILSKQNKKIIKRVACEKNTLKLSIIKLICRDLFRVKNLSIPSSLRETAEKKVLQIEHERNNQYAAVHQSINVFKMNGIDFSFLKQEILYLLAYKLQKSGLTEAEKKDFYEWRRSPATIPARCFDSDDENFHALIRFYDEDPIKTCIALLKNYAKGEGLFGIMMRILSGAWNRHYIEPVNQILSKNKKNELPDNLTVSDILQKLRESGLIFNIDAPNKSRLRRILLFCASLNNEKRSLENLIITTTAIEFFPPYLRPRRRIPFFRMARESEYGRLQTLVSRAAVGEAENLSHGEASAWQTPDESIHDMSHSVRQNNFELTNDNEQGINEGSEQYRQNVPGENSFLLGVSSSSSFHSLISEKATGNSDLDNKLLIGQEEGSPQCPIPRPSSATNRGHSRSSSLCFVSVEASHRGFISPDEREETDNGDELVCFQSFRASL